MLMRTAADTGPAQTRAFAAAPTGGLLQQRANRPRSRRRLDELDR